MAKNKKVRKFSKFANNQLDFILLITVILLLSLGLIMVLSASSPTSLAETGDDSYSYFREQAGFAIVGVIAMLFISKIDYRFWKKFYKIAYIGSIILLLMVLIPGIGVSAGGARRWINLGVQFQPSELAKIGLIIFYASYLTDHKDELKDFKKRLYAATVIFNTDSININSYTRSLKCYNYNSISCWNNDAYGRCKTNVF